MEIQQHIKDMIPQQELEVQRKTRARMVQWYIRMAHKAQFDGDTESYGDIALRHKPKRRDYYTNTTSVLAIGRSAKMWKGHDLGTA